MGYHAVGFAHPKCSKTHSKLWGTEAKNKKKVPTPEGDRPPDIRLKSVIPMKLVPDADRGMGNQSFIFWLSHAKWVCFGNILGTAFLFRGRCGHRPRTVFYFLVGPCKMGSFHHSFFPFILSVSAYQIEWQMLEAKIELS